MTQPTDRKPLAVVPWWHVAIGGRPPRKDIAKLLAAGRRATLALIAYATEARARIEAIEAEHGE